MIELKKCPCCGGGVSVRSRFVTFGFQAEIECRSCGLAMCKVEATPRIALLKAAEAWNKRFSDMRTPEEINKMLLIVHDIVQNTEDWEKERDYFEARGQEDAFLWVLKDLGSLGWT